jgi:sodium/bile acid cotransporter 7
VLKRLSAIPVDAFLLALLATVALAVVLPARGAAAQPVSIAAEAAIALLFFLYGLRLSPLEAWHGVPPATGSVPRPECWTATR